MDVCCIGDVSVDSDEGDETLVQQTEIPENRGRKSKVWIDLKVMVQDIKRPGIIELVRIDRMTGKTLCE